MTERQSFMQDAYYALCTSIHMWSFLAETGKEKIDWPYYDAANIYDADSECLLCSLFRYGEPRTLATRCSAYRIRCPLSPQTYDARALYYVCAGGAYAEWSKAIDNERPAQARDAAQRILDQLIKGLKKRPLLSIEECIAHVNTSSIKTGV